MKIQNIAALAAFAAASQLLHAAAASANTLQEDRASTLLAAQLLADSNAARLALISSNGPVANKDLSLALGVREKMAQLVLATGTPMVVPIYTELDSNAAPPNGWMVPEQAANESLQARERHLEVTYFAIDLNKTQSLLHAAQREVRAENDRSAEASLAAVRSDLIQSRNPVDVPLLTARRDLALAQHALTSKKLASASMDLQNAANSLGSYSSPGHKTAARRLAADIHAAMPFAAQAGPSMSTKIDGWWSSVTTWFSQHS